MPAKATRSSASLVAAVDKSSAPQMSIVISHSARFETAKTMEVAGKVCIDLSINKVERGLRGGASSLPPPSSRCALARLHLTSAARWHRQGSEGQDADRPWML